MVVKEEVSEFNAENAIWLDLWDIVDSIRKYRTYNWPQRTRVINFLNGRTSASDEGEDSKPSSSPDAGVMKVLSEYLHGAPRGFCEDPVKAEEFLEYFSEFSLDSLVEYLTCYANKVDADADMIVIHEEEKPDDAD